MKTILVTGATGAQGGSVARHLLKSGKFHVKALTRNPDSDNAIKLKESGAEIVRGNMDDSSSLLSAMQGCYGVFGVTNFWEHFDGEFQHGKNIINAVLKAGVPHFVMSTLPGYEKLSGGTIKVPHFDLKHSMQEYASAEKPDSIFFHPAYYFENFLIFFVPQKGDDGTYSFGFPQGNVKLAGYSVEDTGGVVAEIFAAPEKYHGKVVPGIGDDLTGDEYAALMSRVLGKEIKYNHIPIEVYEKLDFPGAQELGNMFEVQRLYIPERSQDLKLSRNVYPSIQTFEQWLTANREKLLSIL